MVRAKCPFCGEENDVGLMEEIRPGDPTPMMKMCNHFVFFSDTRYPGVQYGEQEFHVRFGTGAASYSLETDLLRILNDYFKFFGPVAFAPSEEARGDARRAIEGFLKARKILT